MAPQERSARPLIAKLGTAARPAAAAAARRGQRTPRAASDAPFQRGGSLEGVDTGFEQKMALVTGKNVKSTMQGVETSSEESVSEQKQIETETRIENASSSKVEEGINGEEEDDDDNDEEGEEEGSDVPSAEELDDDGEDGSDDNDNDEEGT